MRDYIAPWSLNDIAFDRIELDRVRDNEVLFFVLASASLVESGSDLYTSLSTDYFGECAAAQWLREQWENEELQHGRALRRYVETVWPEFIWDEVFTRFMREYSQLCNVDHLEAAPALELVARCVVETGTAALYGALHDYTDEPVLKRLAGLIRADEVRHYKNFNRFFRQYNHNLGFGRWPIFRALQRRLIELRTEDSECALRHVFHARYPDEPQDSPHFIAISRAARNLVLQNVSVDMMVKMFIQPLQIPEPLRSFAVKPCAQVMRHFLIN